MKTEKQKYYLHFLILHSHQPINSDEGELQQSNELIETPTNSPTFELIDQLVEAAMNDKFGEGKWRRSYFIGIKEGANTLSTQQPSEETPRLPGEEWSVNFTFTTTPEITIE